jgi:hypothetical protein
VAKIQVCFYFLCGYGDGQRRNKRLQFFFIAIDHGQNKKLPMNKLQVFLRMAKIREEEL